MNLGGFINELTYFVHIARRYHKLYLITSRAYKDYKQLKKRK
jgi:hypothetical protein